MRRKRSAMCAEAVAFPADVVEYFSPINEDYRQFLTLTVADAQLEILKKLCQNMKDGENEFLKFIAMIFIHVSNKHPIKSFTLRYIMRSYTSHDEFSEILAREIITIINSSPRDPKIYANLLTTVITPCYENFPPGAEAARKVDLQLLEFLKNSLVCTIIKLIQSHQSPTLRSELFNLLHMTLKLMLQLLQQSNDDRIPALKRHFGITQRIIKKMFGDREVPKDTKTLAGIVLLLMHLLEHDRKLWIDVLKPEDENNPFTAYLTNDGGRLALYTAVVTLAPVSELKSFTVNNNPAIIKLTVEVLAIGDRSSSDSTSTLLVSRVVMQISRILSKIEDLAVGEELVRKMLDFIWSHLEHYMDSVRHLASQILASVIKYYAGLPDEVRKAALERLVHDLNELDRGGKSFYVCAAALAKECGAVCLLEKVLDMVDCLLDALNVQALQSSALNCIDVMISRHLFETNVETVTMHWTTKMLTFVSSGQVDFTVIDLLKTALNRAIKLDGRILESLIPISILEIADADYGDVEYASELRRTLFILNVIRSCDDFGTLNIDERYGHWKGLLSYRMLLVASTLASQETRILALSSVVCSLRSTEPFCRADLDFILHFLKYNMDPQYSGFKQCLLSYMDKFMSRFSDSYQAASRRHDTNIVDDYVAFIRRFLDICYDSLLPGLNHRRREFALCLLLRMHRSKIDPGNIPWQYEYVERLLGQLDDTYEQTIEMAYNILGYCPEDLIKHQDYPVSLDLEDILWQATSSKPNETISASYKLLIARTKTREDIIGEHRSVPRTTKERVDFILLKILVEKLREQLAIAQEDLVTASTEAPMYGILRCMYDVVKRVNVQPIATDASWTWLTREMVTISAEVNTVVALIVTNASPEGLLPSQLAARSGEAVAGPSRSEVVAGPSRSDAVAGPSRSEVAAGPSRSEVGAGTTRGQEVAGPNRGQEVAEPSRGLEVAGPNRGQEVAGPSRGEAVTGPSRAQEVAGPSRRRSGAGPGRHEATAGLSRIEGVYSEVTNDPPEGLLPFPLTPAPRGRAIVRTSRNEVCSEVIQKVSEVKIYLSPDGVLLYGPPEFRREASANGNEYMCSEYIESYSPLPSPSPPTTPERAVEHWVQPIVTNAPPGGILPSDQQPGPSGEAGEPTATNAPPEGLLASEPQPGPSGGATEPTVINAPPEGILPSDPQAGPSGGVTEPTVTNAPPEGLLPFDPQPGPSVGVTEHTVINAPPEGILPSEPQAGPSGRATEPIVINAPPEGILPSDPQAGPSGGVTEPTVTNAPPEGLLPSDPQPGHSGGASEPPVTNAPPEGVLSSDPQPGPSRETAVPAVADDSAEGFLPSDPQPGPSAPPASPKEEPDEGSENSSIMQNDSQKVLLCTWRSVKESSLLLAELVSRFSIAGEGQEAGNLTVQQVLDISNHFIKLLLETKHRGAFEQGSVGFSKLLKRVLQCSNSDLHELPQRWLSALLAELGGGGHAELSATRRSAGLPFMIQALVASEIQVKQNPKMFQQCMTSLIEIARAPPRSPNDATRTHCFNILRALYRNTTLGEVSASRVGEGLILAIDNFDSSNWNERNAATLLFSSLMVRVFGVQRNRGLAPLSPRNCLTGRIFFQRYPYMYDFMLTKLKQLNPRNMRSTLRPSLFPILLILSRLQPSALDGTASNLMLVEFIPFVHILVQGIILKYRVVAVRAMIPLLTPGLIAPHLLALAESLGRVNLSSNSIHGILLLINRILETSTVVRTSDYDTTMTEYVSRSTWVVSDGHPRRLKFTVLAEYAVFIDHLLNNYPEWLNEPTRVHITNALKHIVFAGEWASSVVGQDFGITNSNYLLFVLHNKFDENELENHIIRTLKSSNDEVVKTAIKYLLLIHKDHFHESTINMHLDAITDREAVLRKLRQNDEYISTVANILKTNENYKIKQKTLKLLTLEPFTQELILEVLYEERPTDLNDVVKKLLECVVNGDEIKHIYLSSLLGYVTLKMSQINKDNLVEVMKEVLRCVHDEECAEVALKFIAVNVETIFNMTFGRNQRKQRFWFQMCLLSILVLLLEADSLFIRQFAADIIAKAPRPNMVRLKIIPSKAAKILCKLLEWMAHDAEEMVAMYTVISLLDRDCSHMALGDDENHAFDPRPLQTDEVLWVLDSTEKIKSILAQAINSDDSDDDSSDIDSIERRKDRVRRLRDYFRNIANSPVYDECLEELCSNCYPILKRYIDEYSINEAVLNAVNRKVELFINTIFGKKIENI